MYAAMVDEVFEEGEEPDPESLREYDERLAALDTPEHAAAFERVRTWLKKNC